MPAAYKSHKVSKADVVRELLMKARFLGKVGIFSFVIFSILIYKLSSNWDNTKTYVLLSSGLAAASLIFFFLMRRIVSALDKNPSNDVIIKWSDFLEPYYVPKFVLKKKRNPFIVEDNED
ncbi:hypothetical protein BMS3Abin07_01825 [bacterium BMS3Abin07]|nr:hypothetical protein BMS3Abin07_01825 [bacterium BMS3Abin07]GBE31998.1 hypothetical protein BMS3Bbin05_00906 [bacterium BMS3Bbin05]HDO22522.1 hypothetical protein [Nitrospirota bacterium]HDZ88804.1 hypothetical protein [Nitrospirota bacterium]